MRMIFVWLGLLAASVAVNAQTLTSPDGNLKMHFIYPTKANQSIR